MKICKNCGATNEDNAVFCSNCGQLLSSNQVDSKIIEEAKIQGLSSEEQKELKLKKQKELKDSAIYNDAIKSLEEKDYLSAINLFDKILDFKDSLNQKNECLAILDNKYNSAIEFKENKQCIEAISLFEELKTYKNSKELLEECLILKKELKKELKDTAIYNDAIKSLEEKDYLLAINLFDKILDFKDSLNQKNECLAILDNKYNSAIEFKENKQCIEAISLFEELKTYKNSKELLEECLILKIELENDSIYQSAIFDGAIKSEDDLHRIEDCCKKLSTISDYKDSSQLLLTYKNFIKEYKNKIKIEKRADPKLKEKRKKVFITTGLTSLFVIFSLVMTFFVFIPVNRQNKIKGYLAVKDTNSAQILENLNRNFGKNAKLKAITKAFEYFAENDYENGIEICCQNDVPVNVSYDANGGVNQENSQRLTNSKINNVSTKKGYTFLNWSIKNYSFNSKHIEVDLDLLANYAINNYSISYNLNGGLNNSSNPTSYNVETPTFVLESPINENAKFIKWVDQNGSEINQINKGSTGDITLDAVWALKHDVNVVSSDINKGTVSGKGTFYCGDSITIVATPNHGYKLDGWYLSNEKVSCECEYTFILPDENLTFEARWTPIEYKIDYVLSGGTNNSSNPTSYNIETPTILLKDPTYKFKSFVKWVDQNNNQITQIITGSSGDLTLNAIWSQTQEQKAEEENYKAHCAIPVLSQDGKNIQYGLYPQTRITDPSLVEDLTNKAGTLPTTLNSQNWSPFSNDVSEIYGTWFFDIDLDNDGFNDYRGIYFTNYRSSMSGISSIGATPIQLENGYANNTVYWFKYEPINWRILQKSDNDYFLMSDMILDSQQYAGYLRTLSNQFTDYQGNAVTAYANNYYYSDLRFFLNTDFYNCAFKSSDVSFIKITSVDNSLSSTGGYDDMCTCETTYDRLFALSYSEILTTYDYLNSEDWQLKNTEYAKCMGSYTQLGEYAPWWLRSPVSASPNLAQNIIYNGNSSVNDVYYTFYGIVPAMHISLN